MPAALIQGPDLQGRERPGIDAHIVESALEVVCVIRVRRDRPRDLGRLTPGREGVTSRGRHGIDRDRAHPDAPQPHPARHVVDRDQCGRGAEAERPLNLGRRPHPERPGPDLLAVNLDPVAIRIPGLRSQLQLRYLCTARPAARGRGPPDIHLLHGSGRLSRQGIGGGHLDAIDKDTIGGPIERGCYVVPGILRQERSCCEGTQGGAVAETANKLGAAHHVQERIGVARLGVGRPAKDGIDLVSV